MMDIELVDGPLDGYRVTWRHGEPYDQSRFPIPTEASLAYRDDHYAPEASIQTEVYQRECFRDSDHVLLYRWLNSTRKALA